MPTASQGKVRFGPFEVDLRTGEVSQNGTLSHIQPQPLRVLSILLERPGDLVTREEFRKRLWPDDTFVDFEHSLNTDIKKLRHCFGDDAEAPLYIETLPRHGYRFKAEVSSDVDCNRAETETRTASESAAEVKTRVSENPVKNLTKHGALTRLDVWSWIIALAITFAIGTTLNIFGRRSPPRVVEISPLTETSYQKSRGTRFSCYLATDGARIFFQEHREGDRWFLSEVSTAGGAISDIALQTERGLECLMGIAPDHSSLLHARMTNTGWTYFSLPLPAGTARRLPISTGGSWATWTKDGKLVYSQEDDKTLYISNADGTNRRRLFSAPDISYPRVSPDGSRIRFTVAYGVNAFRQEIWEAAIDGTNLHKVFDDGYFGDWTADGKLFFFPAKERYHSRTLGAERGFFREKGQEPHSALYQCA